MKRAVKTSGAPAPIGPYSQAVQWGDMLFVSGQIPVDKEGKIETADIERATRLVMDNISAILEAAGMGMHNVLKASIFLRDLSDFGTVNEVYGSYFTDGIPPARETVQVARLPKDVPVEISVIAAKG